MRGGVVALFRQRIDRRFRRILRDAERHHVQSFHGDRGRRLVGILEDRVAGRLDGEYVVEDPVHLERGILHIGRFRKLFHRSRQLAVALDLGSLDDSRRLLLHPVVGIDRLRGSGDLRFLRLADGDVDRLQRYRAPARDFVHWRWRSCLCAARRCAERGELLGNLLVLRIDLEELAVPSTSAFHVAICLRDVTHVAEGDQVLGIEREGGFERSPSFIHGTTIVERLPQYDVPADVTRLERDVAATDLDGGIQLTTFAILVGEPRENAARILGELLQEIVDQGGIGHALPSGRPPLEGRRKSVQDTSSRRFKSIGSDIPACFYETAAGTFRPLGPSRSIPFTPSRQE